MALRARPLAPSEYNCNDHREDEPSGYLEWHEWACKMGKTHIQHRCPECGLYKIWISRKDVARLKAAEADGGGLPESRSERRLGGRVGQKSRARARP